MTNIKNVEQIEPYNRRVKRIPHIKTSRAGIKYISYHNPLPHKQGGISLYFGNRHFYRNVAKLQTKRTTVLTKEGFKLKKSNPYKLCKWVPRSGGISVRSVRKQYLTSIVTAID